MLSMTCDRCGKHIPQGEGGRDRWRFGKKDLVIDLCIECQVLVRETWKEIIEREAWSNQNPLEVRNQ